MERVPVASALVCSWHERRYAPGVMKILSVIVGAICSLLLVGCSDDSEEPAPGCTPRCEEDTRVTCGANNDAGQPYEIRNNCAEQGLHCALAGGTSGVAPAAVCALESERLADCKGRTSICQSNYVTTCYDGFPMTRVLCEATNRVCFGGASEAGCVLSATAEPKCADAGNLWVCDGDVAIDCFEGRATAKHDCAGCAVSGTSITDSTGKSCL